jgi:hypothetical protein
MLPLGQVAQAILDNDDRAIDNETKLNDHQLKAGGFKSFRRTSPPTERENG